MKQVYSYQEIRTFIDQRKPVLFACHPEARVTAVQKHPDRETITVTIQLSIRETCVGSVSDDYASMLAVLDAFDLDEGAERWQEVGEEG